MSLHGLHSSNAAQRGLTIVELMVSMTVGLLVLSLVTYTYMLNKQSWKFNEQDARIQDRGRYVMSMMNADLRLAGYRGCQRSTTPSLGAVGNLANLLDKGVDVAQNGDATKKLTIYGPVAGGNFSLTSALAVNDEPTAIAVSALTPDMIAVSHVDGGSAAAHVSFVLIDDCKNAYFAKTGAFNPTGASIPLSNPDPTPAFAAGTMVTWYDWGVDTDAAGAITGTSGTSYAYEASDRKLTRNGETIASEVAFFRVCFGLRTGSNDEVTSIVFNPSAADMERVIAVQADLILASDGPVLDQNATSQFSVCGSDTPVGWTDRKLRRLFSTTVALRNKVR